MSRIITVALIFGFMTIVVQSQKYTTKYDNINVNTILKNSRLLNSYIKCVLDQGRCSAEGNELKHVLPDALTTNCRSCSEKQKAAATKIIDHLIANKPDAWRSLSAKYDPQGLYYMRLRQQG